MKRVGVYHILSVLPIWTTVSIFATIFLTVFVGRDILEGIPYNVAYSSLAGDVALMVAVLIAADILQRNAGRRMRGWHQNGKVHRIILLSSMMLGMVVCVVTLSSRSGQLMDVYHDIIIAPLFLYLAVTLLPLIFGDGNRMEKRATILLILLWAGLVGFDIKYDRLNQRQWLFWHIFAIARVRESTPTRGMEIALLGFSFCLFSSSI